MRLGSLPRTTASQVVHVRPEYLEGILNPFVAHLFKG